MSSFLDDVTTELSGSVQESTPAPETETTPVETTDTKPEEVPEPESTPEESVEKADTVTETEPVENSTPAEVDDKDKPKKDLSGLTKEEKAAYAFRRQLEKQKAKYEGEISKMMEQFAAVRKDVDELKNPKKPEEPKTRTDFESDDDYIKYLNKKGLEEVLAEQKEADAKAKAEQEEAERAQREVTETFSQNCQRAFNNEEQYAAFAKKVNKALANKFGEILDEAPAVRDYVFGHPDGPLVLDKMLSNRDAFVRIMSRGNNPIAATIEMYEMAKELKAERAGAPAEQPHVQEHPQIMPSIGKPGKGSGNSAPDVFGSDDSLLKYIRGR